MKRLFFLLVFVLAAGLSWGQNSLTRGTGQALIQSQTGIVGLVPGSTSKAASNVTTVNAYIASNGYARLTNTPGSTKTTYYINSPIIIGQTAANGRAILVCDPGVEIKNAPSSNGSVIVSAASQRSFVNFTNANGVTTYDAATTVTAGATSATQTLGSNANIAAGDTLYYVIPATVSSITNSTTVVFTSSITTTTSQSVNIVTQDGQHVYGSTTVTSGATSATQTVGSTTGMAVGCPVYFVVATGTVASVSGTTTVVMNSSVTTSTGNTVNILHKNGSPLSWSATNPLLVYIDATNGSGITFAKGQAIQLTGWIDRYGTTTGPSSYFGVFEILDATSQSNLMIRLKRIPSGSPIPPTYVFTCSSANATVGATYTNNGNTYTVLATIASGTRLVCSGSSAPLASGTLTKASGTGDSMITYSADTVTPYTFRVADVNTTVQGGIWNYNHSGGNIGTGVGTHTTVWNGVYGLNLSDMSFTDNLNYSILDGGNSKVNISNIRGINCTKDGVHNMGPLFDVTVDGVWGSFGDDCCVFDTINPQAYMTYDFAGVGGDVLNCVGRNITCANGGGVAIYPMHGAFFMDEVGYERVNAEAGSSEFSSQPTQVPQPLCHMYGAPNTDGTGAPQCGTIYFRTIQASNYWPAQSSIINIGSYDNVLALNVTHTIIENVTSPSNPQPGGNDYIYFYGPGTYRVIDISGCTFHFAQGTSNSGVKVQGLTILEVMNLEKNRCWNVYGTGSNRLLNALSAGSWYVCNIKNNSCKFLLSVVNVGAWTGCLWNGVGNYVESCSSFIGWARTCSAFFSQNAVVGSMSNNWIYGNATGNTPITLLSGTQVPTSIGLWKTTGTQTLLFTGDCSGCQVDISATGVSRSPGAIVYNTNSALGTLAQAGLVCNDSTTSANSWHLLVNPTLVY